MNRIQERLSYFLVALFFAAAFFMRCANPAAPQGGPIDTLPPVVLSIVPENFTINFSSNRITVTFDEYVTLKNLQSQFIVSPPMEKKPAITVRGRTIVIDIKSELDSATTYRFDFGNAIVDNNEGNPLRGFSYVFSTGDVIDSLVMSGQVTDALKGDSVYNALAMFFDAKADSMAYDSTVFKSKMIAVSRTDSAGIFIAENLKDKDYRVYALVDKNGNAFYDPGIDKIGFLDTVFNPLHMPEFRVWFDTAHNHLGASPQIRFRVFEERAVRRQNLSDAKRPLTRKLEFFFASPDPQILSMTLNGIDTAQIIRQTGLYGDTLVYWLKQPAESIPDTIKGEVVIMSLDSLGKPAPVSKNISLAKPFEAAQRNRDRNAPQTNPFEVTVAATSGINPERDIPFTFAYPLLSIDSSRIVLEKVVEPTNGRGSRADQQGQQTRMVRIPARMVPDSKDVLRWKLTARWENNQKYNLSIPAGVFTNIAGEQNDTLRATFTTFNPDKFGVLVVDVQGNPGNMNYILSLVDKRGGIRETKPFVVSGKYTFNFVEPGEYRFQIIEDMNGNGRWDTGNLVNRIQPERVTHVQQDGQSLISVRAGWEMELIVDVAKLFGQAPLRRNHLPADSLQNKLPNPDNLPQDTLPVANGLYDGNPRGTLPDSVHNGQAAGTMGTEKPASGFSGDGMEESAPSADGPALDPSSVIGIRSKPRKQQSALSRPDDNDFMFNLITAA